MSQAVMGVYFILNTKNGKKYVGSSVDINRRLRGHINALRKGTHVNVHLRRAWDIDGEECFETGICEVVDSADKLIEREQFWIDTCGDYNLAPAAGSTLGFKQSEEFKEKARVRMSGENNHMFGVKRPEIGELMRSVHSGTTLTEEHKRKMSLARKGVPNGPMSDETKAKISDANRGKVRTDEHRLAMSMGQRSRPPISDGTREKLRAAKIGTVQSDEAKAKISAAKLGKKLNLTEDERRLRAERARNRVKSEEECAAVSARQKGVPRPPEVVAKMSATMMGKARTEESKAKQRATIAEKARLRRESSN